MRRWLLTTSAPRQSTLQKTAVPASCVCQFKTFGVSRDALVESVDAAAHVSTRNTQRNSVRLPTMHCERRTGGSVSVSFGALVDACFSSPQDAFLSGITKQECEEFWNTYAPITHALEIPLRIKVGKLRSFQYAAVMLLQSLSAPVTTRYELWWIEDNRRITHRTFMLTVIFWNQYLPGLLFSRPSDGQVNMFIRWNAEGSSGITGCSHTAKTTCTCVAIIVNTLSVDIYCTFGQHGFRYEQGRQHCQPASI